MKNYKIILKTNNNSETIFVKSDLSREELNKIAETRAYNFFDMAEMESDNDFDNWSSMDNISDNYNHVITEISTIGENYEIWN